MAAIFDTAAYACGILRMRRLVAFVDCAARPVCAVSYLLSQAPLPYEAHRCQR